jgi:hypothetical protein
MNRKLWIVVGVIAIVFLLSNLLPIDGGGLRTEEPARLWADPGSGTSLWDRVAPYLGADLGLLGWILLGLAGVLLVAVVGRALTRTPGKERRQARRLARRGRPLAEIARRMGLSQDAVRTLLDPGPARPRRSGWIGKLFRPAKISPFRGPSEAGADAGENA